VPCISFPLQVRAGGCDSLAEDFAPVQAEVWPGFTDAFYLCAQTCQSRLATQGRADVRERRRARAIGYRDQ